MGSQVLIVIGLVINVTFFRTAYSCLEIQQNLPSWRKG